MSANPSTESWQVRQTSVFEAREPVLALWKRNLPEASPNCFLWTYESGRASIFLLSEPRIVGSAGCLSRRFAIAGEIVAGGAAIDLNVDENRRLVGPALMLTRAVTQAADDHGIECLYGLPIPSAATVLKRCGYRQIGTLSNWAKVLRSEFKLRTLLRSGMAAKLIAPLMDQFLRWKSFDRPRLPQDVIAESLRSFDERFEKLWWQTLRSFGTIGERTPEFLTWRFSQCPEVQYKIFALSRRGELLGYVVWYWSEDSICIADLLAKDESTQLLLTEFTQFARQRRASVIRMSCFAPTRFYRHLQMTGFSRRQDSTAVLVRSSVAMPDWYLTMADHDANV